MFERYNLVSDGALREAVLGWSGWQGQNRDKRPSARCSSRVLVALVVENVRSMPRRVA